MLLVVYHIVSKIAMSWQAIDTAGDVLHASILCATCKYYVIKASITLPSTHAYISPHFQHILRITHGPANRPMFCRSVGFRHDHDSANA